MKQKQRIYGSLEIGIGHLSSLKRIVVTVQIVSEGENDPAEEAFKSAMNGQVKMLAHRPLLVDIRFRRRPESAGRNRRAKQKNP